MERQALRDLVNNLCPEHPKLMQAIIQVESSWDPWAIRYEPLYKYLCDPATHAKKNNISIKTENALQKMSWGLAQVMAGTARELGYTGPIPALIDPKNSVYWGYSYLKTKLEKYKDIPSVVSAYNAGTARKRENTGEFFNAGYVRKVMQEYANLL